VVGVRQAVWPYCHSADISVGDGRLPPRGMTTEIKECSGNEIGVFPVTPSLSQPVVRTCVERMLPGDYDGDGRADFAIYRRATGEWFVHRSSDGGVTHASWGAPASSGLGDVPVPGDYEADFRADFAIYRGSTGEWFIHRSSDGGLTHTSWGAPALGDVPVSAKY
jgi:hypothetical protein